jgi:hypothetical protein
MTVTPLATLPFHDGCAQDKDRMRDRMRDRARTASGAAVGLLAAALLARWPALTLGRQP